MYNKAVLLSFSSLLFKDTANSARSNSAFSWKKAKKVRIWESPFAQITGHQLVFLADCKDVVVSCVIVEPIYNHEREGRGNFVQEGKSGELASPPSLTQSSSVGGRLSASRQQQQRQKAPNHLLLSYSPS